MKKGQRTSVVLFVALITIIVGIDSNNNKNGGGSGIFVGALTGAQCKAERNGLVQACKPVVARRPPSPLCCQLLRGAHVECVCPVITPKLAALIDVNYAIRVVQGCGRRVPRHYKCGKQKKPSSKATYRKKVVLIVSNHIGLQL
ncbi:hypothetical protein LguiB_013906 [Lonicera macranthoides]